MHVLRAEPRRKRGRDLVIVGEAAARTGSFPLNAQRASALTAIWPVIVNIRFGRRLTVIPTS
jgi:hypothetical protein